MSEFIPETIGRNSESKAKRYLRRVLVALVVVICIAALAVVATTVAFRMIDSSLQQKQTVALSEQTALTSLNSAQVPAPDLTAFALVDGSNLIGPRFESIVVGEIEHQGDEAYRDVTATASYRNGNISVTAPVTQRFVYDDAAVSWVGGEVEMQTPQVTPLRAPSTYAIGEALPTLLASYDADLAQRFAEGSTSFETSLDETGGVAIATLSKRDGSQLFECEVTLEVTWSDTSGWQINVKSVGDVRKTALEESVGSPVATLTCSEGDLVELSGTLAMQGDKTVLKTDALLVNVGARSAVVNRFELSASALDDVDAGQRVTVQGRIGTSGTESSPFTLEVTSIR